MIDPKDFITREGGNPEKIKESQRRRHAPVEAVDEIIELYEDHRKTQYEATQIGSQINSVQKAIGQKKKAKENADDLLKEKEELTKKKQKQEELAAEKHVALLRKVKAIGNYVHDSVPVSDNEDNNEIIRKWAPDGFKEEKAANALSHHEITVRLDAYDPERGVKIVGHRGYCLRAYGVFLNLALINYGLEFLFGKGYTPNQPPFFMLRDAMAKTGAYKRLSFLFFFFFDVESC
jgi:seryl-tRNA synthetase